MSKYVIIGGVAGGMSAAARLRRISESAEIIVFEKGNYVSYANCGLPYYVGGVITDNNLLTLQTPESFNKRFNVDVRVNCEVISIDRLNKKVRIKTAASEYDESYDKLVLSPGAEPIKPDIKGIDNPKIFTIRTIPDTYKIKDFIASKSPKTAVVIGAGYIGLEMAENLSLLGIQVTVVEAMPQVLNVIDVEMAAIAANHLKNNGVKLILGQSAKSFSGTDELKIELSGGNDIYADMVILSIGVKPDVKLAKECDLEVIKGICVNDYMQTSDPNIYAVGDAVEVLNPVLNRKMVIPLAGPANKQGRLAADNIVDGNTKKYRGTFGTSVLKVFDLTVAATGASAKALNAENIPYETVIVHPGSHAGYYPGAAVISLKLIFSPSSGRILGAQAIGPDMAEKKIDVISALMLKEGTIYDMMEFEQAYAPPYSSAKDAVNMAGFVAENIISGKINSIMWDKILANREDFILIDVRSEGEFLSGSAPGAINIPVDDLRNKLKSIPSNKKIGIYCGVGIRSYIAARILNQSGFNEVYNISGGFFTYANMTK